MTDRNVLTITLLAVATAFLLGVFTAGWSVYGPTDDLTDEWGTIPPLTIEKGDK